MKFEKIDKKEEGKFITRYDITYKTVDDTDDVPKIEVKTSADEFE